VGRVQVLLEGLHPALVSGPHATLAYLSLDVQQQLVTGLAVVAGTPRVEYVQVRHCCSPWGVFPPPV
jgi:hypothetical protein